MKHSMLGHMLQQPPHVAPTAPQYALQAHFHGTVTLITRMAVVSQERDREALRAEVVAAELASAAQAVGSSRGSRARLSSDFMTMMGEMDEGPDWNRSDQVND